MRIDKTVCELVSESDYDFRAWRVLLPETINGIVRREQLCALLINFRRGMKNRLSWTVRLLWRSGSGYKGGKTITFAWRSDSSQWARVHRGIRKGFLGFEVSTSANGPYIAR